MNNKIVGALIIFGGIFVFIIWSVFLVTGLVSGKTEMSGIILGVLIGFVVVVLPTLAAGIFIVMKSGQEMERSEIASAQRKILDMVAARGEVTLSDLIIELQMDRDDVKDLIYQIVGLSLFSGYINWDSGTLFSSEASELKELSLCKNCGGNVSLAGKGVLQCPHCGTEYFIS